MNGQSQFTVGHFPERQSRIGTKCGVIELGDNGNQHWRFLPVQHRLQAFCPFKGLTGYTDALQLRPVDTILVDGIGFQPEFDMFENLPLASGHISNGKLHLGRSSVPWKTYPIPPDKPDDHLEKTYLTQMQAAYADHLHKPINCSDDLPQTCRPEYAKQREYFYDAEGMRRNLRDVIENGEQEFDALKVDLYDGICDICASDYADGLLRMRATLSQAAGFPLSGSAIAQFPSMIKAAEKKGLCHMLVNDHKLEWVQGNA